jgi:hypothetical protein
MYRKVTIVDGKIIIQQVLKRRPSILDQNVFSALVNTETLAPETVDCKQPAEKTKVHLVGIKIDLELLQKTTMVVVYRTGEYDTYGGVYRWNEPQTGLIEYSSGENYNGEPGIIVASGGWRYTGFNASEDSTGIWSRYNHEEQANSVEHCLQILAIESSFCMEGDCGEEHCGRCHPKCNV